MRPMYSSVGCTRRPTCSAQPGATVMAVPCREWRTNKRRVKVVAVELLLRAEGRKHEGRGFACHIPTCRWGTIACTTGVQAPLNRYHLPQPQIPWPCLPSCLPFPNPKRAAAAIRVPVQRAPYLGAYLFPSCFLFHHSPGRCTQLPAACSLPPAGQMTLGGLNLQGSMVCRARL